jgi:hypothetical protein
LLLQIFEGIRDFIVQSVELKFNCFFLMPLVDTFPQHLREQLEGAWEEDIEGERFVWLKPIDGFACWRRADMIAVGRASDYQSPSQGPIQEPGRRTLRVREGWQYPFQQQLLRVCVFGWRVCVCVKQACC